MSFLSTSLSCRKNDVNNGCGESFIKKKGGGLSLFFLGATDDEDPGSQSWLTPNSSRLLPLYCSAEVIGSSNIKSLY